MATVLIILLSTYMAIVGKNIIPMLLTAYKIFSSTIAPLIFVSILSKMLKIEITLTKTKKFIIGLILVLSSGYIILAEVEQQLLKIPNYNLYILIITTLTIGISSLAGNKFKNHQQS
ncbi:MAG: hypothetical protein ACK4F9_02460 [Brevinematia bacterium]